MERVYNFWRVKRTPRLLPALTALISMESFMTKKSVPQIENIASAPTTQNKTTRSKI